MKLHKQTKYTWRQLAITLVLAGAIILTPGVAGLLWLKHQSDKVVEYSGDYLLQIEVSESFPIGVDPLLRVITEDPQLGEYVKQHLSINLEQSKQVKVIDKMLSRLAQLGWYQQLATPSSRILVIYAGERREEVVKNFGDILRWTLPERQEFSTLITDTNPVMVEGKFYPGRYVVPRTAKPAEVATLVQERFNQQINDRYSSDLEDQVPLHDALTIASLLEREAYDFTDMRIISGIIWNRLFIDMPLQLDASLQYVRGSQSTEAKWWPKVVPADKFIDSPFNTYQAKGLPPSPIANPSVEAVVAALNPEATDCLFYFHDTRGNFYCTETYADHVSELRRVYGRGS